MDQARANPLDVFRPVFRDRFLRLMLRGVRGRQDAAARDQRTADLLTNDPGALRRLADLMTRRVWREARETGMG